MAQEATDCPETAEQADPVLRDTPPSQGLAEAEIGYLRIDGGRQTLEAFVGAGGRVIVINTEDPPEVAQIRLHPDDARKLADWITRAADAFDAAEAAHGHASTAEEALYAHTSAGLCTHYWPEMACMRKAGHDGNCSSKGETINDRLERLRSLGLQPAPHQAIPRQDRARSLPEPTGCGALCNGRTDQMTNEAFIARFGHPVTREKTMTKLDLATIREELDVALLEWGLTGKPVAYDVLTDLDALCDEVERWMSMAHASTDGQSAMVDPIRHGLRAARDHGECPVWCWKCGEQLASSVCEHCHGSGVMPADDHFECERCVGAGKVHEECAEKSYAALADEVNRVRNALSAHPKTCDHHADDDPISCGWKRAVADVESALRGDR